MLRNIWLRIQNKFYTRRLKICAPRYLEKFEKVIDFVACNRSDSNVKKFYMIVSVWLYDVVRNCNWFLVITVWRIRVLLDFVKFHQLLTQLFHFNEARYVRHKQNASTVWWIKRLIVTKRLEECISAEDGHFWQFGDVVWLKSVVAVVYNITTDCFQNHTPGLPPGTFAWTVSSELLGFWFYFILIFSFLGRALD